jgi:L-fuconolactonase
MKWNGSSPSPPGEALAGSSPSRRWTPAPGRSSALRALVGRPLVRGVRHLIQGESDPGFCLSPAFVSGVRECGELGLTFDICVRHPQLSSVVELVEQLPRRRPSSSTMPASPTCARSILESWRSHIAALAALPNVSCKVSGLVTEAGTAALDPDRFVPTISHLLETFGPSRLLFGSDWPVVKLASPYTTWLGWPRLLAPFPNRARPQSSTATPGGSTASARAPDPQTPCSD